MILKQGDRIRVRGYAGELYDVRVWETRPEPVHGTVVYVLSEASYQRRARGLQSLDVVGVPIVDVVEVLEDQP